MHTGDVLLEVVTPRPIFVTMLAIWSKTFPGFAARKLVDTKPVPIQIVGVWKTP